MGLSMEMSQTFRSVMGFDFNASHIEIAKAVLDKSIREFDLDAGGECVETYPIETGGILLISSAFQWKHSVTPKSLWLGGFHDPISGEVVKSKDSLIQVLSPDFEFVEDNEISL